MMVKKKRSSWGFPGLLLQGAFLLLGFIFFALFSWGTFETAKGLIGDLPNWVYAVVGLVGWVVVGLLRDADPKSLFFKKLQ